MKAKIKKEEKSFLVLSLTNYACVENGIAFCYSHLNSEFHKDQLFLS